MGAPPRHTPEDHTHERQQRTALILSHELGVLRDVSIAHRSRTRCFTAAAQRARALMSTEHVETTDGTTTTGRPFRVSANLYQRATRRS
eukprot:7236780-Prymnesium_polylepis.1